MLKKITVILSDQEKVALQAAAEREMRGVRDQARFVIRQELERRGLLKPDQAPATTGKAVAQ